MKQGKCCRCKVRYVWEANLKRSLNGQYLACPGCGDILFQTSRYWQGITIEVDWRNIDRVKYSPGKTKRQSTGNGKVGLLKRS